MKILRSNRGATLLELVAAIAIFSVVGLAAFTLLMFSIRTNNYIVDISESTQEANLLNTRLELFFEDKVAVARDYNEGTYGFLHFPADNSKQYFLLTFEGNTLKCGKQVFSEKLSRFSLEKIKGTNLIQVSYSIGEREFTKIFRLQDFDESIDTFWGDDYWNNHSWDPRPEYIPPWYGEDYHPGDDFGSHDRPNTPGGNTPGGRYP